MEEIVLKAQRRAVVGKQVKALRRQGLLPAVLYGKGIDPLPIQLNYKEASHVLPHISSSHLIRVDLEGELHHALVREKQRHPIYGTVLHVDLNVVSMTEKLRAQVALVLSGEAPAVKELNGTLVQTVEELEVECLPQYLPDHIVVDLSSLKEYGDAIHVRDISLPPEVEVLNDPDEIVVVVTAPTVEAVEAVEAAEAAGAEPEVIERGKKEEEEE